MKVAIVGAGLIGRERIEALQNINQAIPGSIEISSVFDISQDALANVKSKYQVNTAGSLSELLTTFPDWVIVATSNDAVKDVVKQAFEVKANVLMEKPFGRSLAECDEILGYKPNDRSLFVGFNYRFFAGVEAALHDAKNGKFGKLISVNMILGHGNSPGMEKSWRFDPKKCGDSATDLGVHLFDLMCQLSAGNPSIKYAKAWRGFWNTGIDEESHIIAEDDGGTIFNLQTSLNRWRNTFRIEINGTEGYGVVENRGRNYGPQSYRAGKRWGWLSGKSQAESEEIIVDKDSCADSFTKETISALGLGNKTDKYRILSSACQHDEARKTMVLLEKYRKEASWT